MKKAERMLLEREVQRMDHLIKIIGERSTKERSTAAGYEKYSRLNDYHNDIAFGLELAESTIKGVKAFVEEQIASLS